VAFGGPAGFARCRVVTPRFQLPPGKCLRFLHVHRSPAESGAAAQPQFLSCNSRMRFSAHEFAPPKSRGSNYATTQTS
jgi:hypothetical protein